MYLVKKWDFKKRMFLHNLLKPIVPALVKHCSQDCAIMRDTPHEHNLVEHNGMKDFLKSHLKFHIKIIEGLGIIK